jgi:hypothetical protein
MAKKILLTYATTDNHYALHQRHGIDTFLKYNNFDTIYACNESNLLPGFLEKNKRIFESKEGGSGAIRAGFWLWKPYLIKRCLDRMNENDILMYADATIYQKNDLTPIFNLLNKQSIIPFKINDGKGDERDATKRDAFVLMNCDNEKYWTGHISGQLNASHIFFKKDAIAVQFVEEWLHYCEDYRIITESDNTQGLPNYPAFVCHRHDQSVYSLLIKKYGFNAYTDLTQHGNSYRQGEEKAWGQLLIHGR